MNHVNYLICRCEEVSRADIEEALQSGAQTAQEVKMKTRAGMGICQGRTCRSLVERLTGETSTDADGQPSTLTFHNPVRPVYLGQLVVTKDANSD